MTQFAVVIPTIGRSSLATLLTALVGQDGPPPVEVVIVDDRPLDAGVPPLALPSVNPARPPFPLRIRHSGGRGPAAARNVGWRTATASWIAFLDDDVVPPPGWSIACARDLASCAEDVGGVQGVIRVPLPPGRPTDWERNTAGLQDARWATADMAYRRHVLEQVGGFDERFVRAYREDADLAVRVRRAGWRLERGELWIEHPVRPAGNAVSVKVQAGNADDALLRNRYGPRWRAVAETGPGRTGRHLATVLAAFAALLLRGHWRIVAVGAWSTLTMEFLARRVMPGPRPTQPGWTAELGRLLWTTPVIPMAAVLHRLRGAGRFRNAAAWPPPIRAVLFDRDGTLVHDVPYNSQPASVRPVAGARAVLENLRASGIAVGIISNQSGVGRGFMTPDQLAAVDERIAELLGPFGVRQCCPHRPDHGCGCRKPLPLMIIRAARSLAVEPFEVAMIGDIGTDVQAAIGAGARAVLVPNESTRPDEITAAPLVAGTLSSAVDLALGRTRAVAVAA